jgi:membrane protease YdiL (CAAX protease family)
MSCPAEIISQNRIQTRLYAHLYHYIPDLRPEHCMRQTTLPALAGLGAAIAITTTMDATGYAMFSALPLLPLAGLFWYLQRFSRVEFGLVAGKPSDYVAALAYPVCTLSLISLIALVSGATDSGNSDWHKALANMALMSSTGVIMTLLTEEGFFRGWLWASLKRAGHSDTKVLVLTTLAFTVWHISAISLDTGFDVPAREIPVYLINATLIGAAFGILRAASGSIVVAAVCHAVWNGLDYPLFGFGEKVGALGIEATHIFGPEVGLIGIPVNALAVLALYFWWRRRA